MWDFAADFDEVLYNTKCVILLILFECYSLLAWQFVKSQLQFLCHVVGSYFPVHQSETFAIRLVVKFSTPDNPPQLFGDISFVERCKVEGRDISFHDNRKDSGFLEAIDEIGMLPRVRWVQWIHLFLYPFMRLFLELLISDRRLHLGNNLMKHFPYWCLAKLVVIDVPNWLWTYI